tara:strand:- start:779 stop:913 length:135 start_codon:yes stop_codon:yes gene_type:complete
MITQLKNYMPPIDEVSLCFYRAKYKGGIIDTPLYPLKVIELEKK